MEAYARQLLREQINHSAWFSGLSEEERSAAIGADVERWWCLKTEEAARLLVEQFIAGASLNQLRHAS